MIITQYYAYEQRPVLRPTKKSSTYSCTTMSACFSGICGFSASEHKDAIDEYYRLVDETEREDHAAYIDSRNRNRPIIADLVRHRVNDRTEINHIVDLLLVSGPYVARLNPFRWMYPHKLRNGVPVPIFKKPIHCCRFYVTIMIVYAILAFQLWASTILSEESGTVDISTFAGLIAAGFIVPTNEAFDSRFTENATLRVAIASSFESEHARLQYEGVSFDELGQLNLCITEEGKWTISRNLFIGLLMLYTFLLKDFYHMFFVAHFHIGTWRRMKHECLLLFAFLTFGCAAAVNIAVALAGGTILQASIFDAPAIIMNALAVFVILEVDDTLLPIIARLLRINILDLSVIDDSIIREEMGGGTLRDYGTILLKYAKHGADDGMGYVTSDDNKFLKFTIWRIFALFYLLVTFGVIVVPLGIIIYSPMMMMANNGCEGFASNVNYNEPPILGV